MEIIIEETPDGYDSDNVRFEEFGVVKGYGFRPKGDKTIALTRCPKCGRENYVFNVLSGQCTWCPFNANEIKK